MKPEQGIVVACAICGLVYVQLWWDIDDSFACPLCGGITRIGKGLKRRR